MPNHVRNRLEIIASDGDVKNVTDFIRGEPYEDGRERIMDFNKIILMPEALNIEPHNGIENAIKNALKMEPDSHPLISILEMSNRETQPSPLTFNDTEWDLFLKGLNNVRQYGYISWYEWACFNWGTKWNAYEQSKEGFNVILFDTAWSNVSKLIIVLSNKFPTVKFKYEFSDEDIGHNCGSVNIKNGLCDAVNIENCSNEAYYLAFKLRPDCKKYYVLENGKYVYKEEE